MEEQTLSFAEAAASLKNEGYDLEKERSATVALHEQCGIVQALAKKGVIRTEAQYGALFDQVRFSAVGIRDLIARLRHIHQIAQNHFQDDPRPYEKRFEALNYDLLPIFNSGHLSYRELWALLEPMGIGTSSDEDDIFDFREVAAKDIDTEALSGLDTNERDDAEKRRVMRIAFDKAPAYRQDGPRLLFTSALMEEQKAPLELLTGASGGIRYIDPISDLIRFMTQFYRREEILDTNSGLDDYEFEGMYLDRRNTLYYPLHVLPSGRFLSLRNSTFGLNEMHLYLIGDHTGYTENDSGTRKVLYG